VSLSACRATAVVWSVTPELVRPAETNNGRSRAETNIAGDDRRAGVGDGRPGTTAKDVAVPKPTVAVAADAGGMANAATVAKQTALIANAPESEFRRRASRSEFFRWTS